MAQPSPDTHALYDFGDLDAQAVFPRARDAYNISETVRDVLGDPKSGRMHAYQSVVRATRWIRDTVRATREVSARAASPSSCNEYESDESYGCVRRSGRVPCSLVLCWWQALLDLASRRGFGALWVRDHRAHAAFARWVSGEKVWRACVDAVIEARDEDPSTVHPELMYMMQFEDTQGRAELAERRVTRVEAAESKASKAHGNDGFVRFCSRNADALCELSKADIENVMYDLHLAGSEVRSLGRFDEREQESKGSLWTSLMGCMCAPTVSRTDCESPKNDVPTRSALSVRRYVDAIAVAGAPRSSASIPRMTFG